MANAMLAWIFGPLPIIGIGPLPLLCALVVLIRLWLPRPVLVSLPYSHYVELARWALQKSRTPFVELRVPIGPHVVVVAAYRLLFGGLGNNTSYPGSQKTHAWRDALITVPTMRRLSGVPVFIGRGGRALPDSWSVLRHCGFAIEPERQLEYDAMLGPAVRQFAYFYVFQVPGLYRRLQSCGRLQMWFFDMGEALLKTSTSLMPRLMDLDAAGSARAENTIRQCFAAASEVLRAGNACLGTGSGAAALGGADLAFAALSGWIVLPPRYTGGVVPIPDLEIMPAPYRVLCEELRDTPAGKHVLRLYEDHR